MLMLNWYPNACIVQAGHPGSLNGNPRSLLRKLVGNLKRSNLFGQLHGHLEVVIDGLHGRELLLPLLLPLALPSLGLTTLPLTLLALPELLFSRQALLL